ncbi:hypothetical protein N7471_012270 [Penicillium samsonianum]|uniref:uncharacterized protein n=1 Tax=Penicillium samsonianum TaxID=1882272 RepID=UPI0025469E6B|nr:uncharacterized protein N7471_012270 [Penicillium samsonianum]KAJ6124953.1 hypothetical protein N7471_012270 [Penicillium samsonianum]
MTSMQLYQTSLSCEPFMNQHLQDMSGCCNTQQMNDWFLGSESAGSLYQSITPNPTGPTLGLVPADVGEEIELAFEGNTATNMQQCLSPLPTCFAYNSSVTPPSPAAASLDTSTSSISPPTALSNVEVSLAYQHNFSSPVSAFNQARLAQYGIPVSDGLWRCAHLGCTSQARFRRGCDLRKHFNRHRKQFLCRYNGCSKSKQSGFSSKKDRNRHEAMHNPSIICECEGCERVFSRVDNMKDHARRVHRRIGKNRWG